MATGSAPDDDSQMVAGGEPFPLKLHVLLEDTVKRGFSSIISWKGDRAFQVHNKELFAEMVMPVYFDSKNYKTFQRNLNLWGFRTVSKGPRKGECSHALFVRGQPDLCRSMVRVRNKTNPPERFYQQGLQAMHAAENEVDSAQGESGASLVAVPGSSGNTGVGGTFAASLGHQGFGGDDGSGASNLGSALASLLHSLAASNAPSGAAGQQQQQQQQQQQPQILQTFLSNPPQTASQQILQLLGLQQQAQQRTNTLPTGMSMTAPGSSFQTAAQLQCQPIQQPQQQQSPTFTLPGNTMVPPPPVSDGGSDMTSSLESIVDEGKQRQKSARERGSTILACRARGMAMEHNIHTAFFEISADTAHGTELVCSYPQCQNGGVKFLYCKFCNDAIARRSFRSHHLHNDQNEAASQQSVARRTDPQEQEPPKKRLKTDSSPSSPKEGPSLSNTASSMEIKSIKVKWETLLEERKDLASENDVSPWLMKVLALSEQYAKQCKRMLKSN
mmetsp:Transcript_26762/g.50041  ORF Transcript_26762/g.50041 Transcript_26762/m.50041 type:complete len:501 (+) Transcript_26762:85-1587(+)